MPNLLPLMNEFNRYTNRGSFHGSKFGSISLAACVVKMLGANTSELNLKEASSTTSNFLASKSKSFVPFSTLISRVPSNEISKVITSLPPGRRTL